MVKRAILGFSKILAILILCFLIFLAIICGYLAGSMLEIAKESPQIDPSRLLSDLKENSTIVDPEGKLIAQIETVEYRKIVPYDKIPKNLVNAFVAAEDKRFYEHNGVDLIGIAATVRDFLSSGDLRGASTITMQLARNVYLNNDVNWTRKIQEIFLALQIDQKLSKDQIMEAYLNRIFFGQNAYGVEAASQIYFSKSVSALNLAQAAAIASIVPAPSQYSLYSTIRPSQVTNQRVLDETVINGETYKAVYNPPAYERAHWILGQMLAQGKIDQAAYDQAISFDVAGTIDAPTKRAEDVSNNVTDLVREQAIRLLMDAENISEGDAKELLLYGGLTITSTIDMNLQRKLQELASSFTNSFRANNGARESFRLSLDYDRFDNIIGRDDRVLYYAKKNLLTEKGEVIIPENQYDLDQNGNLTFYPGRLRGYTGYLDIMDYYSFDENDVLRTHRLGTIPIDSEFLTIDNDGTMHIKKSFLTGSKTPLYRIDDEKNLILSNSYYSNDETGVMEPQLAFTVLDTTTGEVRATIGGREQDDRHFLNRAAFFPRQPGSSFKPIAEYAAAVRNGYNAGVGQDDAPVQMIEGEPWPKNVDFRFRGMMSMQEALVRSSNPVAVRWLDTVGIDKTKEILKANGIINEKHPDWDNFVERHENPNTNDENLAMALGALSNGMTTMDMAGAYQAFGNNGSHVPPMSIAKIQDNTGKVYYENKHEGREVLKPALNFQMQSLLRHVARDGFAAPYLRARKMDVLGKTGTTNLKRDFWFIGVTPYYTTAVWTGADNGQLSMSGSSSVAASLYTEVARVIEEDLEPKRFPDQMEGVYEMTVSDLSGKKATSAARAAGGVLTIPVSAETVRNEEDDVYVFRTVDIRNNLLASDNTPGFLQATRVFIKRPSDYKPSDFGGIYPEDWGRNVPTRRSNLGFVLPESDESSDQSSELAPERSALEALRTPPGQNKPGVRRQNQ